VLVPSRAKHTPNKSCLRLIPATTGTWRWPTRPPISSAPSIFSPRWIPVLSHSGKPSFELVFRNLCTTLIAIDDYCNTVWTGPGTDIAMGTSHLTDARLQQSTPQ
jgi:hypothetical protein